MAALVLAVCTSLPLHNPPTHPSVLPACLSSRLQEEHHATGGHGSASKEAKQGPDTAHLCTDVCTMQLAANCMGSQRNQSISSQSQGCPDIFTKANIFSLLPQSSLFSSTPRFVSLAAAGEVAKHTLAGARRACQCRYPLGISLLTTRLAKMYKREARRRAAAVEYPGRTFLGFMQLSRHELHNMDYNCLLRWLTSGCTRRKSGIILPHTNRAEETQASHAQEFPNPGVADLELLQEAQKKKSRALFRT